MLKRDWERDQKDLMRQLHTFVTDETPLRLLIFPEGTTINTKSMEKCRSFAKQVRTCIYSTANYFVQLRQHIQHCSTKVSYCCAMHTHILHTADRSDQFSL
jgi:1-acyl-sn-glycerol-3-phosphate acyltransferase